MSGTYGGRKLAAAGRLRTEEALHALRLEAGGLPPQRAPGGRPGFLRPPARRGAEQHQRADELVVPLLGPPARSSTCSHSSSVGSMRHRRGLLVILPPRPARLRRGWGRMPQSGPNGQSMSRYASQTLRRGLLGSPNISQGRSLFTSSDLYAPSQYVVPTHAAWVASEGILSPPRGRSMHDPASELRRIPLSPKVGE
jgi:hypothetical protein